MKILFLSGLYPPHTKGGGEISTHLIARGLVELGHVVTVITQSFTGERLDENYEGVRVIRLPLPFTAKPLLEKRWAKLLAKQLLSEIYELGEFDVIHAHDYKMTLILSEMASRPIKLPSSTPGVELAPKEPFPTPSVELVATVRDYAQISGTTNYVLADGSKPRSWVEDAFKNQRIKEASLLRKPFRLWQYLWNTPYRMRAFRKIQNQIFISRAQRDLISEAQDLSGIKTEVIYNPVSDEYLVPFDAAQGRTHLVLCVGRVEDYKGVGLLLDAWREVVKSHPEARLRIVGEGAQLKNYQLLISNYQLDDFVEFVGRVPNEKLRETYDEAQIVVAPHLWVEPFGRTVAEAMARGKVVVAANTGGPAEMIRDGKTGFLFERGSQKDLEQKLKAALSLSQVSRPEMGGAAQAWVKEKLMPAKIADQYARFYSHKS